MMDKQTDRIFPATCTDGQTEGNEQEPTLHEHRTEGAYFAGNPVMFRSCAHAVQRNSTLNKKLVALSHLGSKN